MKRSKLVLAVGVLFLIGVSGCNSSKKEAAAPAPHAQPSAQTAQAGEGGLSGKVVETMNAGGYTYVSLENNGKKTWVAVPEAKVTVGQQITCQPGMPMENFTSKTLNRTFPVIIFSGGIL